MASVNLFSEQKVDPALTRYIIAADRYLSAGPGGPEEQALLEVVGELESNCGDMLEFYTERLNSLAAWAEGLDIECGLWIGQIRTDFKSRFGYC
jgi:hypothetical protein